ncbi:MAG: FAD-dependent oxidoreductase [Acidobacteria bacterium]|nr:FAD-dependent oxidoreductase [Acidobacteriota bacterium]MBI3654917.1 FAD-dependent oxidoreductase [Acidobacteriota bacterium]
MKKENGRVIFETEDELPITAVSSASTEFNKTGSWKYLEPYYENLTPPCINKCLTGQDIVTQLRLTEEGRFAEAVQVLYQANPFPSITGRVCPHPCEQPCNRKAYGGGITIRAIEHFLGDYAATHHVMPPAASPNGKAIAVIGSGPAGLSAAFFLSLLGYSITVFEALQWIGGLLRTGIPSYRLPKYVVDDEVQKLRDLGVQFEMNKRMGKNLHLSELGNFSATLLAIGRGASMKLGLPAEEHDDVWNGIDLLQKINVGEPLTIGPKVVVIGGGNTAIDCARSLLRLGCEPKIIYRRTKAEMPAFKDEVKQTLEEEIPIDYLIAPMKLIEENGKLIAIECLKTRLGEKDESGRQRPVPIEGSNFSIPCDAVVKALGEKLDGCGLPETLKFDREKIIIENGYRTSHPGIFSCGDCANGEGTVGDAIRHGREASLAIHASLLEMPYAPSLIPTRQGVNPEIAKFKQFNLAYFQKSAPPTLQALQPNERIYGFQEIESGLARNEAMREAARCFKCGTCTMCDNCRVFCPDMAIRPKRDRHSYEINYDYCKGCGVCVEECPRGAIHLRKVDVGN